MFTITEAVKHLIIINIIMFVTPMFLHIDLTSLFAYHFPENELFKPWQLLTSMFMHADWQHLIFNMIALWMFGSAVEETLGIKRFLFIYFSAGIGASLIKTGIYYYQFYDIYNILTSVNIKASEINEVIHLNSISTEHFIKRCNEILANNTALKPYDNLGDDLVEIYKITNIKAVGASGAIFGILATYAVYFPNHKMIIFPIPIPIKSSILVTCMVFCELFWGVFALPNDNIGRYAHVGGAIVGFLIAFYWIKNNTKNG